MFFFLGGLFEILWSTTPYFFWIWSPILFFDCSSPLGDVFLFAVVFVQHQTINNHDEMIDYYNHIRTGPYPPAWRQSMIQCYGLRAILHPFEGNGWFSGCCSWTTWLTECWATMQIGPPEEHEEPAARIWLEGERNKIRQMRAGIAEVVWVCISFLF